LANKSADYLSVLEDVLKDLGVDNLSVLYYHLEKLGVKKNEIPDKPVEFSNALRVIFGQAATILEKQIVSTIATKTGGNYDRKNSLAEALRSLKESAVT
jgi:hypothetical protein